MTTTASTSAQVTGDPSRKHAQLAGVYSAKLVEEHINTSVQLAVDHMNTSAQPEGVPINTDVQIAEDIENTSSQLAGDNMLQFEAQQAHDTVTEPILHTETSNSCSTMRDHSVYQTVPAQLARDFINTSEQQEWVPINTAVQIAEASVNTSAQLAGDNILITIKLERMV